MLRKRKQTQQLTQTYTTSPTYTVVITASPSNITTYTQSSIFGGTRPSSSYSAIAEFANVTTDYLNSSSGAQFVQSLDSDLEHLVITEHEGLADETIESGGNAIHFDGQGLEKYTNKVTTHYAPLTKTQVTQEVVRRILIGQQHSTYTTATQLSTEFSLLQFHLGELVNATTQEQKRTEVAFIQATVDNYLDINEAYNQENNIQTDGAREALKGYILDTVGEKMYDQIFQKKIMALPLQNTNDADRYNPVTNKQLQAA